MRTCLVSAVALMLSACFADRPDFGDTTDGDTIVGDTAVGDTAGAGDGTPQIVGFDPAAHAVDAAPGGPITVTFNLPMQEPGAGHVIVRSARFGAVSGDFSDDVPNTVAFEPDAPLAAGDQITVTLRRLVRSAAGEPIARSWVYAFTTASAAGHGELVAGETLDGAPNGRLLAADFNEDGTSDLLIYDHLGTTSIALSKSDGTFDAATKLVEDGILGAVAGDFTGDGHLDLVLSPLDLSGGRLWVGDGAGGFSAVTTGGNIENAKAIAAGDLDGDGDLDLAVAPQAAERDSRTLINNGDGTFVSGPSMDTGIRPTAMAIADINNDGRMDILVSNHECCRGGATLAVFEAEEGGYERDEYRIGEASEAMVAADVDNDGWVDVVVANGANSNVGVMLNDGTGDLGAMQTYGVGGIMNHMIVHDVDGDGRLDILGSADSGLIVLDNLGAGIFDTPDAVGAGGGALVADDHDGDGDLDIITHGPNGLIVLDNTAD